MTTHALSRSRPGRWDGRRVAAMLILTMTALFGFQLLGSSPANAASACVADPTVGCLQGTIKLSTGKPAVGAKLSIVGPGVNETVITDETGHWELAITKAGDYTVNLDVGSLPSGQSVNPITSNPATITGAPHKNSGTVFKLDGPLAAGADAPQTATERWWDRFAQQAASGVRLGLLLALASVGLSLVYGTTGLSNFAHGEQVTLGGLLAYLFANVLGLNLILAGLIAVILSAASGYFQDALIWKPLRKRGIANTQLMIATIGMSIALQYTFQYFIGAQTNRIDVANPITVPLGPITMSVQSLWAMGIAVAMIALIGLVLLRSRVGRATRAVSDNPALAAASGIDVDNIIRLVWTSSAALAGLAGVLLGLVLNGIAWDTGMQLLLLMFAAVTLGGLGTAFGALAGAMIIGMVVELTNLWLPGDFKYATALVILILVLLIRPQGVFGRRERIG